MEVPEAFPIVRHPAPGARAPILVSVPHYGTQPLPHIGKPRFETFACGFADTFAGDLYGDLHEQGATVIATPYSHMLRILCYLRSGLYVVYAQKAGADVLFAPGLPDLQSVRAVCAAGSKPFNFMVGIRGKSFTVAEFAAAGVRRISLATSLYRLAMSSLADAAREMKDKGTFGFLDRGLTTPEINKFMLE